ncbi:MAG: tetratricopeptide repeat protein [Polyangiaceae bacterium]
MTTKRTKTLGLLIAILLTAVPSVAFADAEANIVNARSDFSFADREAPSVEAAVARAKAQRPTSEQRIANGELLFRMKDYQRAVVVLSEVIEEFPNTPAYPDALWLRGETYYASKEYLAARRDYKALVDHGSEARFTPYMSKALARLIDVSLRMNDLSGLDEVFAKLSQVPPSQVDAGLQYAKGKAYYFRKSYNDAKSSFNAVGRDSLYAHQARYFEGLVAMREAVASHSGKGPANYKAAIEAFRKATELPPDTEDHRHVSDLSWMAIGRLFYEMEQFQQAAEAYSKVGRDSREFDTMLYELAWVYVRLGDAQRAERALEVLSIADPSSPVIGEGTLLRADLLLRAGSFRKALQLYESVKERYDPLRVKVETFLDSTTDPSVYYEKLSQQQLDVLDQSEILPPIALKWAREAEDGPMAFAVIDDVNECRTLIKQSYGIIDRLSALVDASNRVRAFPEILAGEEQALALINRISHGRYEVAVGLDSEEPKNLSGEIATVRTRRRELMAQIKGLPQNNADFAERDQQGTKQWNTLSQEVTRQSHEVDRLNAVINGLRRMLKQDSQQGVARDPATLKRFNDELDTNERDLRQRQKDIATIRTQIDIGRLQVGLGDARYQSDAKARADFRDALEREVALAAQGQGGKAAMVYAQRVQAMLTQARTSEDRLITVFLNLESQVGKRIAELKDKVEAERTKITGYEERLNVLDTEARDLVGKVAKRNFELVRDKLRNIVLRADVGITEQAWEVREEELYRVRNLQTERARQESTLDDELREVLDDSTDRK